MTTMTTMTVATMMTSLGNPEMAAYLFSRLERFREESQGMAAHWSIALNDESSVTQSDRYDM